MNAKEALERKGHDIASKKDGDGNLTCRTCGRAFVESAGGQVYEEGRQGYDLLPCGYEEQGYQVLSESNTTNEPIAEGRASGDDGGEYEDAKRRPVGTSGAEGVVKADATQRKAPQKARGR